MDSELIERAAKAIFAEEQCDRRQKRDEESIDENWNGRLSDRDQAEYRSFASAALDVFEAAQKPTGDERVYAYREGYDSGFRDGERGEWRGDRRRPVSPEPSEAKCEHGTSLTELCEHVERLVNAEPQTEPTDAQVLRAAIEAALCKLRWFPNNGVGKDLRAALRAAAETTNREDGSEDES